MSLNCRLLLILLIVLVFKGHLFGQIYISEFMAAPNSSLGTEWIEIYNSSETEISLDNRQICDLVGCSDIREVRIEPNEYLVFCQDTGAFLAYYSNFYGSAVELSGWRTLNNTGDIIVLRDNTGITIDSVSFDNEQTSNISWERISFDRPGWETENWFESLDDSGATPGRENSVSGGFSDNITIYLEEKLFSPGCSCPYQYLPINIELPRDSYLTLSVYSLEGRKLKIIYDNEPLINGVYYFDGTDSSGNFLAIGMYILLVQVSGDFDYTDKLVFGVGR